MSTREQRELYTRRSWLSSVLALLDIPPTPGGEKKAAIYKVSTDKVCQRAHSAYSGMDLYVFRYEYKRNDSDASPDVNQKSPNVDDVDWSLRNSKPCAHCVQIIKSVGIRYVYYSDENNKIVKVKAKDLASDHITYGRRKIKK